MSDLSLSDAAGIIRSGSKFWRAWAKAEEALSAIEAAASTIASAQAEGTRLSGEIEAKRKELEDVTAARAAADDDLLRQLEYNTEAAGKIMSQTHIEAEAVRNEQAAIQAEIGKSRGVLADLGNEIATARSELAKLRTDIAEERERLLRRFGS